MIVETTINIYPVMKILAFAGIIAIGFILFHNGFSLNLFSKHDSGLFDKFLSKYPDVAPEFMKKGIKEQNIENNQEIHENNKKILVLEQRVERLEGLIKEFNDDIQEQLKTILEELEKRG